MAHDVFLSYAQADKAVADAVCARLEARGARCWYAPRDVVGGASWGAAIVDAIAGARVMVLLFSRDANASKHVLNEVERAVHHELHIVPFRLHDVPPSKELELFVSSRHWLDALSPPLDARIGELAETVERVLGRPRADPAAEAPAPAPAPAGRSRARLALVAVALAAAALALFSALRPDGGPETGGARAAADPPADAPAVATMADFWSVFDADPYEHAVRRVDLELEWRGRLRDLLHAAGAGDALAMACLSYAYRKGLGSDADPEQALDWARRAEATGSPAGLYVLGNCYELGLGVEPDALRAEELWGAARDRGFPAAVYSLAYRRLARGPGEAEARAVLAELEEHRPETSGLWENLLGEVYAGYVVFALADTARAVEAFRRGAEAGYPLAQYRLGQALASGIDGFLERDPEAALAWTTRAAERGLRAAQTELARAWYREPPAWSPLDVEQDYAKARRWAQRAADQDGAEGLTLLARMYLDGHGVPRDAGRGHQYLDRAVAVVRDGRDSYSHALIYKGTLLVGSWDDPVDPAAAVPLFEEAVARGAQDSVSHSVAHLQLGYCYQRGAGVEADPVRAIYHFVHANLPRGIGDLSAAVDFVPNHEALLELKTWCDEARALAGPGGDPWATPVLAALREFHPAEADRFARLVDLAPPE